MTILLVGAGGFFGAITRYLVDGWVTQVLGPQFPWGTMVINVSGSFVLGLLFALAIDRTALPAAIRGPILIGFIGAYTTFSTLTLESWRLVEAGSWPQAIANLVGSIVLGMVAVVAGLAIGRSIA